MLVLSSLMLWVAAAVADPHASSTPAPAAVPAPAHAPAPAASGPAYVTDREGWPDTRAGELGHRWVKAFDTGEAAMKQTLSEILAPESLARKNVNARVERYRDLKERFGALTLLSVDRSTADEVEVTLAAADLSPHSFTFTVQKAEPHKLLTVSMKEPGHMIPGFGH
jgi:hypothetical protein